MRALTIAIVIALGATFGWAANAGPSWKEAFDQIDDGAQKAHADNEITDAALSLDVDAPALLCGYKSASTKASKSLRQILRMLRLKSEIDFETSPPAIYGDQTICVTITPRASAGKRR